MQQLKFHFSKIPHINKFLFDFSQHVILCTKYHGEKQVYTRQNQRKKYGGHCCVFALRIVINSRFLLELLEGSILISTIICTIEDTGDQAFICCLYEKYEHLMFWATGKYLKNIEERKDAMQDSIVALINNLETIKTLKDSYLLTYIVCTVESKSINLAKRRNLELRLFEDLDSEPVGTAVNIIEDRLFRVEMESTIFTAWSQLSDKDKILLESKYILGYNDREIGEMIGCKASSVRMYLTRARRKAMKLISEVNQIDSL